MCRAGYQWIDQNTPKDSRVMAWWDYGPSHEACTDMKGPHPGLGHEVTRSRASPGGPPLRTARAPVLAERTLPQTHGRRGNTWNHEHIATLGGQLELLGASKAPIILLAAQVER